MMLKFGRMAVASTIALALAAATLPSKAEAFGYYPSGYGPVGYGGGYYGGICGCQLYVPAPPPPPPPPCCQVYAPPPCCAYGNGWNGSGYNGGGYYGGGYRGGYDY